MPKERGFKALELAIILRGDMPDSTIHDRVQRGSLVRLSRGIYTTNTNDDHDTIVRQHWKTIVGRIFDYAVITGRSAQWAAPRNGFLFIVTNKTQTISLPSLTIIAKKGHEPLNDDVQVGNSVFLASRSRSLLENLMQTRSRSGVPSFSLLRDELGDWIDHLCRADGPEVLQQYRTKAETLATEFGITKKNIDVLNTLVGAALGTKVSTTASRALRARSIGLPFDQHRDELFALLQNQLLDLTASLPTFGADSQSRSSLAFWEAYFSNFIEGTEFAPDEAKEIVFGANTNYSRPQDAHDILGTYALVSNDVLLSHVCASAAEFLEKLKNWHKIILGGRPEKQPGKFKTVFNQAGNTLFVAPDLVKGTLTKAFEYYQELKTPTQRGIFLGFVVAEVHPFDDGNGRLARAVMNAEFVRGNEGRCIIPTISRNDYLRALRRMSRQGDPELIIHVVQTLRRWTTRIDWSTVEGAKEQLVAANAFVDANDAEDSGIHLK